MSIPNTQQQALRRIQLRALAAFLIVMAVLSAIGTAAKASASVETRAATDISAYIDEPGYTFVKTSVLVYAYVVAPETGPVPTGTISVKAEYSGAKTTSYNLPEGGTDVGSFFVTPNQVGPSAYTVSYSGDANYQPSSRTYTYEVLAGPWTVTKLTSGSTGNLRVGDNVDITATVSATNGSIAGHTWGYIYLYDNGQLVSTASFEDTSVIPLNVVLQYAGLHKFTAVFEPASPLPYAGSASKPLSVKVSPSK